MISQLTVFSLAIEEKPYNFLCSPDSSIEHVKKALTEFLVMASKAEENAKAQQEKPPADGEKPQESVCPTS